MESRLVKWSILDLVEGVLKAQKEVVESSSQGVVWTSGLVQKMKACS